MAHIQLWSPDTCGCSLHQLVEPGNPAFQTRYQTWEQAVEVHARCFIERPRNTVCYRWMPWLLAVAPEPWCRPLFRRMVMRLQPRSKLCIIHKTLGFTPSPELYRQVVMENTSKNIAQHIAWRLLNEISDEDIAWVNLAPTGRLRQERMGTLERRLTLNEIKWSLNFPERQVELLFPAGLVSPVEREAVSMLCHERLGQGRVMVA